MKTGYHQKYMWRKETPEEYQAFHALFTRGASPVCIERLAHPDDDCPVLQRLIEDIEVQDVVYIWSFKALGNTFDKLANRIQQIEEKGAYIISIKDQVDSTILMNQKLSDMIAWYREMTFAFRSEGTLRGLDKARQAGNIGGRRPLDVTQEHILAAEKMYLEGRLPTQIICQMLQIHRYTLYQYLKKRGIKLSM